jgi:hypothetical protein
MSSTDIYKNTKQRNSINHRPGAAATIPRCRRQRQPGQGGPGRVASQFFHPDDVEAAVSEDQPDGTIRDGTCDDEVHSSIEAFTDLGDMPGDRDFADYSLCAAAYGLPNIRPLIKKGSSSPRFMLLS